MAEQEATTMTKDMLADDRLYREAAVERWTNDKVEIDDDSTVSVGIGGAWVHAWVWVSDGQAGVKSKL